MNDMHTEYTERGLRLEESEEPQDVVMSNTADRGEQIEDYFYLKPFSNGPTSMS